MMGNPMKEVNFYIMSGDIIVGKWENEVFELVDKTLAPMYLINTGNVSRWLETRAIDYHRANSRLLKKALRLAEKDDVSTVISVNAATITDNYWIKPFDSTLSYKDVRFDNNMALISRDYPKNIQRKNDVLVGCFNELMGFAPSLKQYIPSLSEDDIKTVLKKVNMKVKTETIISFIMNGYRQIGASAV